MVAHEQETAGRLHVPPVVKELTKKEKEVMEDAADYVSIRTDEKLCRTIYIEILRAIFNTFYGSGLVSILLITVCNAIICSYDIHT